MKRVLSSKRRKWKCSGTGAKPHSAVSSFQNSAARTAQGTAPMDPPLSGAEFIRRRQKRRKKARLSKIPSQPARDKGCGTQCPNTHNAACGIETILTAFAPDFRHGLDTHNAACGIETVRQSYVQLLPAPVSTHTMLRAALKQCDAMRSVVNQGSPNTHNAACGIDSKTALRVLSVTQSRFRMQKAHSNLDDAAHRC